MIFKPKSYFHKFFRGLGHFFGATTIESPWGHRVMRQIYRTGEFSDGPAAPHVNHSRHAHE